MPVLQGIRPHRGSHTRFWSNVTVSTTPGACWIWHGPRTRAGYGIFKWGDRFARSVRARGGSAARIAYELTVGPIPPGMHMCHKCDNPPCVNPEHLFVGTLQDNMADKSAKGRAGKKLTLESVTAIRYLHATGEASRVVLAAAYDVTTGTIDNVVHRRTWRQGLTTEP